MKPILLFFLTLLCCGAAQAAQYHAAPTPVGKGDHSSQSNAGTLSTLPTLRPGDVVVLSPGNYVDQKIVPKVSGTQDRPIVWRAADNARKPVFKGSRPNGVNKVIVLKDISHNIFKGIDINGKANANTRYPNYTVKQFADLQGSDYNQFKDFEWQGANGWDGVAVIDSHYNLFESFRVLEVGTTDDSSDAQPNVVQRQDQLDRGDAINVYYNATNNVFSRFFATAGGHDVIALRGDRNVMQDCVVDGSFLNDVYPSGPLSGKRKGNHPGGTRGDFKNQGKQLVQRCLFRNSLWPADGEGQGVYARGFGSIWRFNKLDNNPGANDMVAMTATGKDDGRVVDLEFYNNELTRINGKRQTILLSDFNGANSWMANNRFYNNAIEAQSSQASEIWNACASSYSNSPAPDEYCGTVIAHNSFATSASQVQMTVRKPPGKNETDNLTNWESERPRNFFGNRFGRFKDASGGMGNATITSSGGSGTSFTVSDADPFVGDQWGGMARYAELDTVVVNGVRAKIVRLNESTKRMTLDKTVSWSKGDSVAVADIVDDSGQITTGVPSHINVGALKLPSPPLIFR